MNLTPDQISDANKSGMEMLLGIAKAQFAAIERLSAFNFNASKAAFEAGVRQTKAVLDAKDMQELLSLNSAAAQPNMENAIAYSRSMYDLATQTQSEIAQLLESQAAEFNRNLAGFLDQVSKTAPAGSDVALAAVKSALASANSARENIVKVAKQAAEVAEANFSAATSVARQTRKKAA